MYGLSQDVDLSFLSSREVEQVAIGLYQVMLGFDEGVRISIEGKFKHFDGEHAWVWTPEPGGPQIASRTVSLLGPTIKHLEGHANSTLELSFSNGCRMTVLDQSV